MDQGGSVLADPAEADAAKLELDKRPAELARPLPEAQAAWQAAQRDDLARSGQDLSTRPLEVIASIPLTEIRSACKSRRIAR
jgi:hypothetical protein